MRRGDEIADADEDVADVDDEPLLQHLNSGDELLATGAALLRRDEEDE